MIGNKFCISFSPNKPTKLKNLASEIKIPSLLRSFDTYGLLNMTNMVQIFEEKILIFQVFKVDETYLFNTVIDCIK